MSPGAARRTDPESSHEAAAKVDASRLERLVWITLLEIGTSSAEEVADYLNIDKQSITPRFAPLERKGLIVKTSEKHRNRSGILVQTWRAIPQPKKGEE